MAVELISDLSAKSWVSQRLWRTIAALKEAGPRFSLFQEQEYHDAALTMAGLATGTPSSVPSVPSSTTTLSGNSIGMGPGIARSPASMSQSPYPRPLLQSAPLARPPGTPSATMMVSPNGIQLQMEMKKVFEGYAGLRDGGAGVGANGSVCTDGALFQHFREMF